MLNLSFLGQCLYSIQYDEFIEYLPIDFLSSPLPLTSIYSLPPLFPFPSLLLSFPFFVFCGNLSFGDKVSAYDFRACKPAAAPLSSSPSPFPLLHVLLLLFLPFLHPHFLRFNVINSFSVFFSVFITFVCHRDWFGFLTVVVIQKKWPPSPPSPFCTSKYWLYCCFYEGTSRLIVHILSLSDASTKRIFSSYHILDKVPTFK